MTDDDMGSAFDDAVDVGANWIRVDLPWTSIQPENSDEYEWDSFDRIVAQALRRNLHILPTLAYTPPWARTPGCPRRACSPANPAEFAKFAGKAAERYAPLGIHTWEVWNEENSADFWLPNPDPDAYTRLLQATSAALRANDPNAFVLLGGLAVTSSTGGNLSIADFLSQPAESPLQYVDALAVHPYTVPYRAGQLGPWASPWRPADSGLPYVREVLAKSGYPDMRIWFTEYGVATGGSGPVWNSADTTPLASGPDHVTEDEQAAIAVDAVNLVASEPVIGALFWYTNRDFAASADDETENHYGLRRADGSAKPAMAALTGAIERSSGP